MECGRRESGKLRGGRECMKHGRPDQYGSIVRRGSPDPAERVDRRSPQPRKCRAARANPQTLQIVQLPPILSKVSLPIGGPIWQADEAEYFAPVAQLDRAADF